MFKHIFYLIFRFFKMCNRFESICDSYYTKVLYKQKYKQCHKQHRFVNYYVKLDFFDLTSLSQQIYARKQKIHRLFALRIDKITSQKQSILINSSLIQSLQ